MKTFVTLSPRRMAIVLDKIEQLTREDVANDIWLDGKTIKSKYCYAMQQEVDCNVWILDRKGVKVRIEFFERQAFKKMEHKDGTQTFEKQEFTTYEMEAFVCSHLGEQPINLPQALNLRECDLAKDCNAEDKSYQN